MLVRVHFRVGKLGPHISLRSFRMLVRVGCDEMFVRVTVSDPYKQKPAQHCPLLRPSSEGGGPVQTFDVQTSGGAAAAARSGFFLRCLDVRMLGRVFFGMLGRRSADVCTCRVRDPGCLYGSGRAYPYKHSGGGPVQTFACTGPLREMFVRVCFFVSAPPPPASCACRDLEFRAPPPEWAPGVAPPPEKRCPKKLARVGLFGGGGISGNNGAGGAPERVERGTRTNIPQGAEMVPPPKRECWGGSTFVDVGPGPLLKCLYGSTFGRFLAKQTSRV